jgi:hypothetical protein
MVHPHPITHIPTHASKHIRQLLEKRRALIDNDLIWRITA